MAVDFQLMARNIEEWIKKQTALQPYSGLKGCDDTLVGSLFEHDEDCLNYALKVNANVNAPFKLKTSPTTEIDMVPIVFAMICQNRQAVISLANTGKVNTNIKIMGAPILNWATRTGDKIIVNSILGLLTTKSVNCLSDDGESPLMSTLTYINATSAINNGIWQESGIHEQLKAWIVDRDNKVKISNNKKLHCRWIGNLDIIECLLSKNADINFEKELGKEKVTPFQFAKDPKCYYKFITGDNSFKIVSLIDIPESNECVLDVIIKNPSGQELHVEFTVDTSKIYNKFSTYKPKDPQELEEARQERLKAKQDREESKRIQEEIRQKHVDSEKLRQDVQQKFEHLDRVEHEVKAAHELAAKTATRVDNIDEALGPKIEINGREQKLLADHVNDHDHVRIFYLSLKLLLRAKLFAGITLSSDDITRQKNQKMDYLAQGIQGLSEVVQVPFLSKLVKGIGSGVQYKNDKSELVKNKKLNTNAAAVLDIEDYCRGLALKLTEYCTPTLINFTKREDAEKLAEEAMKVMIERIKAGHFAQADAKDYLDAFDQVAKAVIQEKKFNELLIRKSYAPIEQKPIQHTSLTPQYSTLSAGVDSGVAARPQTSLIGAANGVGSAHGQNTQAQASHLSQPAHQGVVPAIAKPLAAPKPLSKPVSMTPGFATQAGKNASLSSHASNGQPLATGVNMKQFIVPVR